jgi:asparagine synthetase A
LTVAVVFAVWSLLLLVGFGLYLRDINRRHEAQLSSFADRLQAPEAVQVAALEATLRQGQPRAATAPEYDDLEIDHDLTFDSLIGEL